MTESSGRGLNAAEPGLRRTENPRVGGSIPPLATTPNILKRNDFRASPADYRRASSGKATDHRTFGYRVGVAVSVEKAQYLGRDSAI